MRREATYRGWCCLLSGAWSRELAKFCEARSKLLKLLSRFAKDMRRLYKTSSSRCERGSLCVDMTAKLAFSETGRDQVREIRKTIRQCRL